MATFHDFELDWSALCQECPECWTESDLQLAAELGKTLLERNKELETSLKQHQNVIEDQAQEIEYLTKQTVALREVNDSRLRVYERLEVSVQDLERANHRLALDHSTDKKHIKSLTATIESLETKCEDLQKNVEELTKLLDLQKRQAERQNKVQEKILSENAPSTLTVTKGHAESLPPILKEKYVSQEVENVCEEELLKLNKELSETRLLQLKEQRRIVELEEQLASMVQENNRLQEKIRDWNQNEDSMKSMHEEFSILEEVRQGQLCGRCLRNIDQGADDMSSIMDAEDDDRSVMSSLANEPRAIVPHKLVQLQDPRDLGSVHAWANPGCTADNPYRELVEKYEALLEVQRHQANKTKPQNTSVNTNNSSAPLSLQEELQMSGDFSQFSIKDTDEESGHGDDTVKSNKAQVKVTKSTPNSRKNFIRTPDFSEAETSSSGFSDETSNKATQTDRERPGSFLCTIADGEDCCFSIYDDASQVDSRFRNRPEYRELFKEIFTILKKAAENKDEGEKLPLLDDTVPAPSKAPPVTPANENMPGDFTDETQSVVSSVMSEQSIPFSDITIPEEVREKEKENILPKAETAQQKADKKEEEPKEKNKGTSEQSGEPQRVLTPLVGQPLDYIAASPHFGKKSSRHKNGKHSQDGQGAESPVIPTPPKITYQKGSGNRRRRDYKPLDASPLLKNPLKTSAGQSEWNGSSMQFYNRSVNSPTPSQNGGHVAYQRWNPDTDSWDVKQNTASQEIHKLRKLELSYAEVLRNADKNKGRRRRHQ